jgi:hypothetical protein
MPSAEMHPERDRLPAQPFPAERLSCLGVDRSARAGASEQVTIAGRPELARRCSVTLGQS